jgi:hypothetical protein
MPLADAGDFLVQLVFLKQRLAAFVKLGQKTG